MPKTKLQVKVKHDTVHIGDRFTVSFQRTLRIPDDGRTYPLPPSLGSFPVARIEDYRDTVPAAWRDHGGVFIPMWQREAMWLRFGGAAHKPNAVKVAVGKVCALTGKPFSMELHADDANGRDGNGQDYVVAPNQPWLDGINAGSGMIKQFVAMPLGMGYTVEGQVTGEERFGGIQLVCFEPKDGKFPDRPPFNPLRSVRPSTPWGMPEIYYGSAESTLASTSYDSSGARGRRSALGQAMNSISPAGAEMGLGAGGRMEQSIYPDTHGLDVWDTDAYGRVYIHIVNSAMWKEITGRDAPQTPISASTYTDYGYPWFRLYDEHVGDIAPSNVLAGVKSVKEMDADRGFAPQQDDSSVTVPDSQINSLPWSHDKETVVDGRW
jgi:hypothetical protein